ncbi:MAG: SLC13 family permease [Gordonibacter sp.]|uniref:SLC13 family permease n=1 Tax=Gordonibacter sp. TaxID=1968902 RepID=UPI002FCBC831
MAQEALVKFFSKEGFLNKKGLGLVLGLAMLIIASFIPETADITHQGIMVIGVLLFAVCLWVCGTFPVGVTGILALVMAVVVGAADYKMAFGGFSASVVFYVIAIFSLPALLAKTQWGVRLVARLFRLTGDSSSKLILAFMIGTGLISTVMSDVPAAVLFMGIAYVVLRAADCQPGKSNLGKCMMIAIPIAAVIGGVVTPAGSSFNVLAMGLLQQATGQTISFLDWILVGLPIAVMCIPLCWISIVKILKPEPLEKVAFDALREKAAEAGKPTTYEIRALVMILALPVLWILGSWFPILNVTTVAIIGLAIMFIPGISLLTWDEFSKAVPWTIILMMGSVLSIGGMFSASGADKFITNLFMSSGVTSLDFTLFLLVTVIFVYLLHTIAPVGAAILSLFLPILIGVCAAVGVSAAVPTMLLAFIVAGNFLLPVNPTLIVTYGEGYYTFGDMFKAGVIPAVIFCVTMVLWVPFMCGVLGL